jgi:hypothetical protein
VVICKKQKVKARERDIYIERETHTDIQRERERDTQRDRKRTERWRETDR